MKSLFFNTHVYTGDPYAFAAGIFVVDGIIEQVLPSAADVLVLRQQLEEGNESIDFIDLNGQYLFPGFEDAHNHPAMMARMQYELDLYGNEETATWSAAQEQIKEHIAQYPERQQYVVHGWNEKQWGMLGATDLDALSEKPVYFFHISWHGLVMNSAAIAAVEQAGIQITHEEGRIYEDDFQTVESFTLPNAELMAQLLPPYCSMLLSHGITTVHDLWIASIEQLEAFVQLDTAGKLPLRVIGYISPVLLEDDRLDAYVAYTGTHFQVAGVKVFLDGTIGLKTAAVHEAFIGADGEEQEDQYDEHGHNQMIRVHVSELEHIVEQMHRRGLQSLAVHGIGDAAVDQIISFYEQQVEAGVNVRQWRIEHCEMISEGSIMRLAGLGVTAVMQPNFHWDIHNYTDRLQDRVDLINPFRQLLEAGVPIAFGSDNMPSGPIAGMEYAVRKGGGEHQFMDVREALNAYTQAGSQILASLPEAEERGRIEAGLPADCVVLSENPFEVEDLSTIEVVRTIVEGD